MPFINGRYHINPIMGHALEAAREAEAALAALQQRASRDSSDSSNDASRDDTFDPDDPTSSVAIAGPGPIHHVEIEASEIVPSSWAAPSAASSPASIVYPPKRAARTTLPLPSSFRRAQR